MEQGALIRRETVGILQHQSAGLREHGHGLEGEVIRPQGRGSGLPREDRREMALAAALRAGQHGGRGQPARMALDIGEGAGIGLADKKILAPVGRRALEGQRKLAFGAHESRSRGLLPV
jgi:hypothetical protein